MAIDMSGWEQATRLPQPAVNKGGGGGGSPGFMDSLMSNIGQFLNSDAAPVVLGQAAQAAMGGSPEGRQSWQSMLGGVSSGLGQSRIAANAAKRQGTERNQLAKLLTQALSGDMGYTGVNDPGASTSTFNFRYLTISFKISIVSTSSYFPCIISGISDTPSNINPSPSTGSG